jgi:polyhydroxyalkanoate synthesis repressor PhaR
MPYVPGVISDQTRVLHAALQLNVFTIEQLAELASIGEPVAQAIVDRSRDMVEEVESDAGFLRLYRLRESARPRLTREAIDLADRLRIAQRPTAPDTARTVAVALDAAESSAELRKLADSDSRAWGERGVVQLEMARRLAALVSDAAGRTSLRRRVVQLAGLLEGIPLPPPPQPPASAQRSPLKAWRIQSNCSSRAPRTIWRSPNRRLYDAVERRFITLDDVRRLVNELVEFVVIDKRGRGDITRSILLQIITELEESGDPLMSREFLLELIRCHGAELQRPLGSYLEQSLQVLAAAEREQTEAAELQPQ